MQVQAFGTKTGSSMKQDLIAVVDLGGTGTAALTRAIRDMGVYSEIYSHAISSAAMKSLIGLRGIVLFAEADNETDTPTFNVESEIFEIGVPVMTVAYKAQDCSPSLNFWNEDDEGSMEALSNFVFQVCKCEKNWNMKNFIDAQVELIRNQVGNGRVLLALSGGVDSSVVAALLMKAIGEQLICVHVNNGLMRKGESEDVLKMFSDAPGSKLIYVDAVDRFLTKLKGVADPEEKRWIIGSEFIRIFEEEARKLEGIEFLAQGTIYSDVVESGSKTGKGVKSHHNVGGLPPDLKFKLVEPVRNLFKDEVRACGLELGLPRSMIFRQPFPGPGLAVRCLGAITVERLEAVREADAILREEFALAGLDKTVWQYYAAIPDFRSTGVRDGSRTYDYPVIIRAVNTVDAMNATIERIDWEVLEKIVNRILAEVKHVNRVCYDLSPKPPATIEWE